jgi:hypothetical protein
MSELSQVVESLQQRIRTELPSHFLDSFRVMTQVLFFRVYFVFSDARFTFSRFRSVSVHSQSTQDATAATQLQPPSLAACADIAVGESFPHLSLTSDAKPDHRDTTIRELASAYKELERLLHAVTHNPPQADQPAARQRPTGRGDTDRIPPSGSRAVAERGARSSSRGRSAGVRGRPGGTVWSVPISPVRPARWAPLVQPAYGTRF